MSSGQLYQ